MLLLGRGDGKLEAWDLGEGKGRPALLAALAPAAITSLAFAGGGSSSGNSKASGGVVAAGDAAGMLHLLELPRALRRRGHGELRAVEALLAGERARQERAGGLAAARGATQRAAEAAQQRGDVSAAAAAAAQAAAAAASATARSGAAEQHDWRSEAERAAEARYAELEATWRLKLDLEAATVGAC